MAIVAFSFLFYYKPDSAKGRILIYSVTMNMISDKPLSGHGFHSFKKEYLNYQGKYFEKHPDSNLSLYADDTKFAFNEYLQVAAEFGFIGLMTLALILFYCFSLPVDTSCQSTVIALKASLISICCLSMFSYPLRNTYTFSEVLITILLLCSLDKRTTLSIKLFSILLLVAILAFTLQSRSKELLAQKFITTQINSGSNLKQKLILFSNYYPEFKNNSSFLASYGLNLSRDRQFEKSNHFFTESLKYMNDINIRMLIGCNFQQMKNYKEAENKYIDASNMIPCRFVPLYQLADLYKETGDTVKLLQVAKKIVDKPIKIPSYTVTRIKQEMEDVLHTYTK